MVILGLDKFLSKINRKGEKIGLITNSTGVDSKLNYNFESIKGIKKIFTPEQGLFGNMLDGEDISDYYMNNFKVISLYGKRKSPEEELEDVDIVIYDMEDAGVRYFTLISTLRLSIESAKKFNRKFIILDRPNPLGSNDIFGPVLNDEELSFVGIDRLPIKFAMTPGELGQFFNRNIGADLEIIKMDNYNRNMLHPQLLSYYIPLSLHLPTWESVYNYQAFCLLEATNISVGRGTTSPFMQIGAPGFENMKTDVKGIKLRKVKFRPLYSQYSGKEIDGFYIHIYDFNSYDPFRLVFDIMKSYDYLEVNWNKMEKLLGHSDLGKFLDENIDFNDLIESWTKGINEFKKLRQNYLIYP